MNEEYQESIEILKAYKDKLEASCSNQLDLDIKAFDFAIKALYAYDKIKDIIDDWAVDDDEHELLEQISDIVDETEGKEAEND